VLWVLCVDWYRDGMASAAQTECWLDDRWRWGTDENPDNVMAMDTRVAPTADEVAAASGLLAAVAPRRRVESAPDG
jgi:hypothetical protein